MRAGLSLAIAATCIALAAPVARAEGDGTITAAPLVPSVPAASSESDAGGAEPDSAEPDSAEPDSAEPDSAEPDSAEPEEAAVTDADSPSAPEVEPAPAAPPQDDFRWSLDLALGGGSVVGFGDGGSTGHTFWGGAWFNWSDFGAGLVVFGAYPDSRVQTRFAGVLADFRWYFLGEVAVLRPFVALGLGFTGSDTLNGRTNVVDPVRWSRDGSPLVVAPAVGIRWGEVEGLFVVAEARLINVTHLSLGLGAGFSF